MRRLKVITTSGSNNRTARVSTLPNVLVFEGSTERAGSSFFLRILIRKI